MVVNTYFAFRNHVWGNGWVFRGSGATQSVIENHSFRILKPRMFKWQSAVERHFLKQYNDPNG